MIHEVIDVGALGVITDPAPSALPFNAWTNARNIRFRDNVAEKFLGLQSFASPTIVPYWLLPVPKTPSSTLWIVAGLSKVHAMDAGVLTDITRTVGGDYAASAENSWTGGVLGGIPVINNGVDDPQMWSPATTATALAKLTNWPANIKCAALRPFKQFLVALDITKTATRYAQMVKWSHPADPGSVPASWDETDATKDAGEYVLAEEGDAVIDCMPIRDVNALYKESTVYGMQYIGGALIFRFFNMFRTFGCVAKRGVQEFKGGYHLVFTGEDLVAHNGQEAESVLQGKLRVFLRQHLDSVMYSRAFLALNREYNEVWLCFPENGHTFCNLAITWNWKTGNYGIRDLPEVSFIAPGIINLPVGDDAWSADTSGWSGDTQMWDTLAQAPERRNMLVASGTNQALYRADRSNRDGTQIMPVLLERSGLGFPERRDKPPDTTSMKEVLGVWPRIKGTAGGIISVSVGGQMAPDAPVVYGSQQTFTIGTSRKIDCMVPGVLHSIKFESNSDIEWKLSGYDVDVVFRGRF